MFGLEFFLFALIRFSAFIVAAPIFNQKGIPPHVKIGLAALLAITITPQSVDELVLDEQWLLIVIQEVSVGLFLAFIVTIVFAIVYFAGQLTDVPMGFGMASVFDPNTGTQLPVFSQFYYILAALVFLAVDGHVWILKALSQSYDYLPLNKFFSIEMSLETLTQLSKQIFLMGLQIAAPIMGTMLLVDVALGVVTRIVPQLNVFVLGYPLKIMVGLLVVFLALPIYIGVIAKLFSYDGLVMEAIIGLLGANN